MRRLLPCLVLVLCLAGLAASAAARPYGSVTRNPADRLAAQSIDPYAYDHARHCYRRPSRGALALQAWLTRNARGVFWGIMRCERLSGRDLSLHSEGRAIDWHLDVHSAADRRAARLLIMTFLATDRAGNPHALARRMGIQEIIWNCQSWWSGAERMGPYSLCYDGRGRRRKKVDETLAHRNHMHIGLSRAGAAMRTSYWIP